MKAFFKQLIEDLIISFSSDAYGRKIVLERWAREDEDYDLARAIENHEGATFDEAPKVSVKKWSA